jgi:hypothetical protein
MVEINTNIEFNYIEILIFNKHTHPNVFNINFDIDVFKEKLSIAKRHYNDIKMSKINYYKKTIDNIELIHNHIDNKEFVTIMDNILSEPNKFFIVNYYDKRSLPVYTFPSTTRLNDKSNNKLYVFKICTNLQLVFESIEYQNDPNIYRHIYIKYTKSINNDLNDIIKILNKVITIIQ